MISCLMVTLPTERRIALAKRSIAGYCAQTHADRELVIVANRASPDDVAALSAHIGALDREDIRITVAPDDLRLGALRNLSMTLARGDVICQWDDDDLYHPHRLERQFGALEGEGHRAVYLQEVMQYYQDRHALYLTNWRATASGGHPGTLMARRTAAVHYPEHGHMADRGEDLEAARSLIEQGGVGYLRAEPHLYLYVSHGGNTWDDGHHEMLSRELSVSKALLLRREASLRAGLAPFAFDADSIDVIGNNGIAFRI
jgi:glycosyltransferase involved in cell wall biosynthesis